MSEQPDEKRHDGRLMLGCGGVLFIPLSAMGIWALTFEAPMPQGIVEWCFRILLEELAIGAFLFFSIGFVWAVTGSSILRRVLDGIAIRFAWVFIPVAVVVLIALIIMMFKMMILDLIVKA